jgi:cardiolipin synthase
LLVCDDTLCSCGSTNVDFRSFENNFEANVFVYDSDIVARMKAIIERDMERSQLIDATSYRSSIRVRLFESIVRLFSPLL